MHTEDRFAERPGTGAEFENFPSRAEYASYLAATQPVAHDPWPEVLYDDEDPRSESRPRADGTPTAGRDARRSAAEAGCEGAAREPQPLLRSEHTQRIVIDSSGPLWRIVITALVFGALFFFGAWLAEQGATVLGDFSMLIVLVSSYSISFWIKRKPAQFASRFGPFSRVADALRESADDVANWVNSKTLVAGILIAIAMAAAMLVAKHAVILLMTSMASPTIAIAVGLGVGALVAAPSFFTGVARKLFGAKA